MAMFFSNIRETYSAFRGPIDLRGKSFGTGGSTKARTTTRKDAIGRIVISVMLIALASWLLSADKNSQLASGTIGGIMGYWLK